VEIISLDLLALWRTQRYTEKSRLKRNCQSAPQYNYLHHFWRK